MSRQVKSLVIAAAVSAIAGATAHAQPVRVQEIVAPAAGDALTQSQAVFYADLDLSREAGMKTLMIRLKGAARDVCGPRPDSHEWNSSYLACIKSAVDHALADVGRATEGRRLALNVRPRSGD